MAVGPAVAQSCSVHPSSLPPPPRRAGRGWRLPTGRELAVGEFTWRHHVVCLLVAVHVPLLALLAVLRPVGFAQGALGVVLVAALLGVALLPLPRRARSCAATAALLMCSTVLVQLFDGAIELQFHYFVAVAAIALYQDWVPFALAIGYVGVQRALSGPAGGEPGGSWTWALLHAAFVLAEAALLVVFWHANETSRAEQERMRDALFDGQTSVRSRMEETDRMRSDLIATVSHEFRTPLTGIRAAALTLLKRGERLDDAGRATLLHAVLDQQERLSRLLENMLTAAQATATDPSACAEVDAVAAEVAMLASAARPGRPPVQVLVDRGTLARIDRQALHQVLANLVDNAQQHGAASAVPLVAAGVDERGVWLTVSNEGTTLDSETARNLFQPFTQLESGSTRTREGLGMGLYVVRRLVEVHGGDVELRSEGGWTTVELRMQAAAHVPQQPGSQEQVAC